jgi:predicted CoA-binding protein
MLKEKILNEYSSIALVGVSPNAKRASCMLAGYLDSHGYEVIPVSPHAQEILGNTSYPNLRSVPEPVEVANIFRSSQQAMPIVDEAIKIGAKAVWTQEGVITEEAASTARDSGLLVVMDKYMRKEHLRLGRQQQSARSSQ